MIREKLTVNLEGAIDSLMELTRDLCYNTLSDNHRFLLVPNQTSVGMHLDHNEVAFHEKILTYSGKLFDKSEAINQLWTNNKVPLWINISVKESTDRLTIIELLTSRRLRSEDELNHKADKFPPFHIAVPLPPGHRAGEKFDLNWRNLQSKRTGLWTKFRELVAKLHVDR